MKWHTEQRKISDLTPHPRNPRQMMTKQVEDLTASLEKFDLVEIPAINTDGSIIAGHQRLKIMGILGRGDEMIDVRVPDKTLNQDEVDEYLIRSNKNLGEWDWDELANSFDKDSLETWGFTEEEMGNAFVPDFNPVPEDDQPRLDEKNPVICPKCHHEFRP